jgi:hypothetical protein
MDMNTLPATGKEARGGRLAESSSEGMDRGWKNVVATFEIVS